MLRVDTAGVQAIADRWGASVSELTGLVAPAGPELSCQGSTAAVNAAHVDVAAFTAQLAARASGRATAVVQADMRYVANEVASATEVAAVAQPVTHV